MAKCELLQLPSGFEAMGKPIPMFRKQAAYNECSVMGIEGERAYHAVGRIAFCLEADRPFESIERGMEVLDASGVYRLMAVLLTAENIDEGKAMNK
jgi:hypothetical protein